MTRPATDRATLRLLARGAVSEGTTALGPAGQGGVAGRSDVVTGRGEGLHGLVPRWKK